MNILCNKISDLFKLHPAFIILIGLLSVLIPLNIYNQYYIPLITLLILGCIVILLTRNMKFLITVVISGIIGICIFSINQINLNNPKFRKLPFKFIPMKITAIIVDTSITNKNQWLPQPYRITMKVVNTEYFGIKDTSNYFISAKLPKNLKVKYGEKLLMFGTMINPELSSNINQQYLNYLKSRKIIGLYNVSKIIKNYPPKNFYFFMLKLLEIRDSLLKICTNNLQNYSTKTFLAAFLFCCKQGIDKTLKQNFIETGTIHILAISGLHIGIISIILFIILSFIPIQTRYIIIPIILFIYITIIGFPTSAVRAFLMITIFCVHRYFLIPTKTLNTIALAAIIILIFNPFALLDIGFQYSFIIAFFLILGYEINNIFLSTLNRDYLLPRELLSPIYIIKQYVCKIFYYNIYSVIIAFLASIGVTLYYNNTLNLISLILNLIIVPILPFIFILTGIKILFFWGTQNINFILNLILDKIIVSLQNIIYFAEKTYSSTCVSEVHISIIIIYYIILFILLIVSTKNKNVAVICFCILSFFISYFYFYNNFSNDSIIVLFPPGNKSPTIIITNKKLHSAIIINYPKKYDEYKLKNILKRNGINKLSDIYINQKIEPEILSNKNFERYNLKFTNKRFSNTIKSNLGKITTNYNRYITGFKNIIIKINDKTIEKTLPTSNQYKILTINKTI